jgi:hypothetical protein
MNLKTRQYYHATGGYKLDEDSGKLFENITNCHIIQIPRFKENIHDLNNLLRRLLIFLDKGSSEEIFKKVIEMDDVLQEGYNILKRNINDDKEMQI